MFKDGNIDFQVQDIKSNNEPLFRNETNNNSTYDFFQNNNQTDEYLHIENSISSDTSCIFVELSSVKTLFCSDFGL